MPPVAHNRSMHARIFVLEDEPSLNRLLCAYLERAGFQVEAFLDGQQAWEAMRESLPDLAILDILLPGMDGLSLLERLRANGISLPVILLTAKTTEADRIRGFRSGADDYVVKPFSPSEVVLRVQAVLRRAREGTAPSAVQRVGSLEIDASRQEALLEGRHIRLTPSEFRLLEVFMQHPGWTFSRSQLLERLAGSDFPSLDSLDRSVDVHIANLRKKIGLAPSPIRTVHGVGYRLEAPS